MRPTSVNAFALISTIEARNQLTPLSREDERNHSLHFVSPLGHRIYNVPDTPSAMNPAGLLAKDVVENTGNYRALHVVRAYAYKYHVQRMDGSVRAHSLSVYIPSNPCLIYRDNKRTEYK
ncbi:hypothetical protein ACRALDRAFT_206101 [Sodiomyces alcalophilus JCM 7366]|uniref:uncharacterized protein n=1 Tax=Sodiomyces alcalophilus JCM 7366 TaxID=591952 RepID=UPI0039B528AC